MFGKPEKPYTTYEELCQRYREETPRDDTGGKKKALLDRWSKANAELLAVAEKWDEDDLDRYQLPHPLIGNLTVREMLFFTIYHNLRHASLEGD